MMKRFKIVQSDANIVSHGGLSSLASASIVTPTWPGKSTQVPLRHDIRHSDVTKNYLVMVCLGKNDFEAINTIESQYYFVTTMDVDEIPSEATLRQRMDHQAKAPHVGRTLWQLEQPQVSAGQP